jgi:hypothetical protein
MREATVTDAEDLLFPTSEVIRTVTPFPSAFRAGANSMIRPATKSALEEPLAKRQRSRVIDSSRKIPHE